MADDRPHERRDPQCRHHGRAAELHQHATTSIPVLRSVDAASECRADIGEGGQRERYDHDREQDREHRCQQHTAVHEVAALAQPVDAVDQSRDHDGNGDGRRRLEVARPARQPLAHRRAFFLLRRRLDARVVACARAVHPGADDDQDPCDDSQDDGKDKRVGAEEVAEVDEALMPLGAARVLRDSRVGHEQCVVAHPEDLVAHRQHRSAHHHTDAHLPCQRRQEDQHQCDPADHGEFRSDQRREPRPEREEQRRRGSSVTRGSSRTRVLWGVALGPSPGPRDQQTPEHRDPEDAQAVFQTTRGEVTRGRDRDVDDRTQWQQQRDPGCSGTADARSEQSCRAVHRDRDRRHREHQRDPERDVLELAVGDPGPEPQQVGPRRRGVCLDTLAGIEHRAVAREEVSQGAQHDQTVVGDPPTLPCSDREECCDPDRPDQETDRRRPLTWSPRRQKSPTPRSRRMARGRILVVCVSRVVLVGRVSCVVVNPVIRADGNVVVNIAGFPADWTGFLLCGAGPLADDGDHHRDVGVEIAVICGSSVGAGSLSKSVPPRASGLVTNVRRHRPRHQHRRSMPAPGSAECGRRRRSLRVRPRYRRRRRRHSAESRW